MHTIIEASIEKGALTHSLETMPRLKEGERIIWDAFLAVSASRSKKLLNGGEQVYILPEAVKVGEIASVLDLFGVGEKEQRCRILRILQKMDKAYLEAKLDKVK